KADPFCVVTPRYWVPAAEVEARLAAKGWTRPWLLGWRDIARATDERTMIATVFPRGGVGNKFLLMMPSQRPTHCAVLLACVNSLVFDYTTRQKFGSTSLTYTYLKQLPVLPPSAYREEDLAYIAPRVLELVYTTDELAPFARDLGYHGPPFRWDEERRAELRAELDAYYAGLYGLTRKQLRYILDPHDLTDAELEDILDPWEDSPTAPRTTTFPGETFRVLKDKEIKAYGEFRTKRLALAAWERLGYGQRGPQRG
ncbi:MAG: hypothetical protein NZ518_09520, partial [Dehalococcoidia bacterium]|nr:hypothetical protein [Dehalococcoidia bacterium]